MLKTVEALHNQKDYEGALRALEAGKAKVSPGLWHYNMGTLYGKLENLPMARFHLLSADMEGYSTKELYQNKELIESKLDIPRLENAISTSDYMIKGSLIASEGILTFLSLILIIFGIFALWKKMGMKIFGAAIFCSVVLLGLNFWIHSWKRLIVIEQQPIHEGPSVIFGASSEVPPGVMLITKKEGEWINIIYPTRYSGWIKDKGLKELK